MLIIYCLLSLFPPPHCFPPTQRCVEQGSPVWFNYIFSFYALIDITAIVPFYIEIAHLIPASTSDYLRMLRILRLLKLDKYIPSVSLVDDVFRNKVRDQVSTAVIGTFCANPSHRFFW